MTGADAQVSAGAASVSAGIGRGRFDAGTLLAWALVLIPLGWGVWVTLMKAEALFR